jgi:hypothetical protein
MIRAIFILAVVAAAVAPVLSQAGQIPAYEALRSVGRDRGETWLGYLVEMSAADAGPQPEQWTLSFKDDAARGGVREFVVSEKGVVSERTPVMAQAIAAPGVMPASGLKVDSPGAFTAANNEASKVKLGFHSLNYRLQNKNGDPVWKVQLLDVSGQEVGMMEISAKSGAIVTPLRRALVPLADDTSPGSVNPNAGATADGSLPERWVEGGGLVGHMSRWSERTWKTTSDTAVKVGDSIGAFFTGRPPAESAGGN